VCYFFNRPRTPFIFENFKNRGRRNVKIIPGFNLRWFLLAAAFFAGLGGLGFGSHASAQYVDQAYLIDLNSRTATKLGAFSGYSGHASGINDAGQVVGSSTTAAGQSHAFITGPNGAGMRDLGTLGGDSSYAVAINASGQVAGVSATSTGTHAFITGPNGVGMRDLGVPGGFSYSGVYDINDTGQVLGYFGIGNNQRHAFITGPNGVGMTDLGIVGENCSLEGEDSTYVALNGSGQVVGSTLGSDLQQHAFITGPNSVGMKDLGALYPPVNDYSEAHAVNDAGQVAGSAWASEGIIPHAFITGPDGVGMRDLGTLAGTDWSGSEAHAINEAGQVAGESDGHAFITGSNGAGMIDLNSLADLPKGVILVNPIAINNVGQVIAYGYITVVPEPESYALLPAGLALLAALVHRKKGASLLPAPS